MYNYKIVYIHNMSQFQQIIQDNSGLLFQFGVDISIFGPDTNSNTNFAVDPSLPFSHPFQLPIQYLSKELVHPLSPIVSQDLELAARGSLSLDTNSVTMYDHLFKPSHSFAKDSIKEWAKQYTTDIAFLNETKTVLAEMPTYILKSKILNNNQDISSDSDDSYSVQCDDIMAVWCEIKENPDFMSKYSFVEWNMLKFLNQSQSFLQAITLANIISPVMSLLMPILFLIFPFIILKLQNIPITFSVYLEVLRDIAKNHLLGQALNSMKTVSSSSVAYALFTVGMYLWSVYQNITQCQRFYKNVRKINDQLFTLKDYTQYSIASMTAFSSIHYKKPTYAAFCEDVKAHTLALTRLLGELNSVQPFKDNIISKIPEVGYMLKCLYSVHSTPEFDSALRFSVGFEGYIDNMKGVYANIGDGRIAYGQISNIKDSDTVDLSGNDSQGFVSQYYPTTHNNLDPVPNDVSLTSNAVITGPNASGKTTFLKTTMINIILTQQVGCGFYKECSLVPYTHIHSYLNIPDTSGRDSLFQAESRRCKEILDIINTTDSAESRHFCIFDELYSGTNPVEATKSAYSFLTYLAKFRNVDFMLTTHYTALCDKLEKKNSKTNLNTKNTKNISNTMTNYQMMVEEDPESGAHKYLYKIQPGISKIQGAIKILMEMEYPDEIIRGVKEYDLDTDALDDIDDIDDIDISVKDELDLDLDTVLISDPEEPSDAPHSHIDEEPSDNTVQ